MVTKNELLTVTRLRELFSYDRDTGEFRRRVATSNRVRVGDVIAGVDGHGYRRVWIDGRSYKLHRLAWLYVHGEFPLGEIDHINNSRGDNRIANLRVATTAENQANTRRQSNNTSGFKGVSRSCGHDRWRATITVNGRQHLIGCFATREMAHAAYVSASRDIFGDFARAE